MTGTTPQPPEKPRTLAGPAPARGGTGPNGSPRAGASLRPRRLGVVVALVLALAASGFTRDWASRAQREADPRGASEGQQSRGSLSGMNSFALALMLGGLRGPLVMFLWSEIENQKIDRDLSDVDTMIEWVRMLQSEFDTVHIFQIWNRAYNLSVMMASPANKYTTIMDAVAYARDVDRERPGDLNILSQLGNVYADKLGGQNVTEHTFYRRQFRMETMPDDARARAYPNEERKFRQLVKWDDQFLSPELKIKPEYLRPTLSRPAGLSDKAEWNDGSELQYLAPYDFPYGISPIAMGYNYFKRSQVSMTVGGQKPLQLSESVIDSKPGLSLKAWSEEEDDRALVLEAKAFGLTPPAELHDTARLTAPLVQGQPVVNRAALESAVWSFGMCGRLSKEATAEYHRHLNNPEFLNKFQTYASHLDELAALGALGEADRDYLAAFTAFDRQTLLENAARNYRLALTAYSRILLTYYTEDQLLLLFPPGIGRENVKGLSDEQIDELIRRVALGAPGLAEPQYADERTEYGRFLERAATRLRLLQGGGPDRGPLPIPGTPAR